MKAACLAIFVAFSAAFATPITFQFTGTVTQVPVDDIYFDIAFGDVFQGSFTFDSAAPDLIPGDSKMGSYTALGLPYGMTIAVAGHIFNASDSLNIGISKLALADIYTVLAATAGPGLTLELFLLDSSATALPTDGLPLSPPALANFGVADFRLHQILPDFSEAQVDGQLSSLSCIAGCAESPPPTDVPEPASGLLLCAGVMALAVLRRKSVFIIRFRLHDKRGSRAVKSDSGLRHPGGVRRRDAITQRRQQRDFPIRQTRPVDFRTFKSSGARICANHNG